MRVTPFPIIPQELAAMRAQLTGTVNVEVDAAPQQDMSRMMEEIRTQYEGIIDKHRRDQEAWFTDKVTVAMAHLTEVPQLSPTLIFSNEICKTKICN